jgi:hypothetical protein
MQTERLQMTGHIEGRPAQDGAVRKSVRKNFAEQRYGPGLLSSQ